MRISVHSGRPDPIIFCIAELNGIPIDESCFFPIPESGSQILYPGFLIRDPQPIFLRKVINFLCKKYFHSLTIFSNFFKNKTLLSFVKIFAIKKLFLDPRSGMKKKRIRVRDKHPGCTALPGIRMEASNLYQIFTNC